MTAIEFETTHDDDACRDGADCEDDDCSELTTERIADRKGTYGVGQHAEFGAVYFDLS